MVKKTVVKFVFCTIILCFSTGSWAGESLKSLQEKAVSNREMIEKYRTNIEKSELDVRIGKSGFLPSANLAFTANSLDESSMFENKENSRLTGMVSYNIFSGFKDKYGIESAQFMKKSKEYELAYAIQNVQYGVAVRYLDIFSKKNSLTVAEDEYRLLEKRYKDTENRFNVGLVRKNDLLKIRVELDDADQRLKKAHAEFQKSVNLMAFEIGADIDAGQLTFSEFDAFPEIKTYAFYEAAMLETRSDIKALESARSATENQVKAAKAAIYPMVDIAGSLSTYGDNHFLGIGDDHEEEARIQVNVKMNLFDGFSKYHVIEKAKLDVKNIETDLTELKNSLTTELQNIFLDYDVALKNVKVAESSISQAEENLRITDISFKEGVETAADVLDAIYYLSRAKNNFINAKNEVFFDYYKLVRMMDGFGQM